MPLHDRLGLIFVMCLSIFSMVMSILKTYWVFTAANSTQNSVDVQYDAIYQVVFGVLEQCVVIIMGCIPSIRHVVIPDFKIFSSLSSTLASLFTTSKSKKSTVGLNNPSAGGYYDLENRSVAKSDQSATSKNNESMVTGPYRIGSGDNLVPDNRVKRTDEVSVAYSDAQDYTRRGEV
jgi:hypothetical protein